jgi:hypothetical protein
MNIQRFCSIVSGFALLAVSADVLANGSAAAFRPASQSDAPSIGYNGYYLWNADPNATHTVVADLGVTTATSMTVRVRGNTQGLLDSISTCAIRARGLTNASNTEGPLVLTGSAGFFTMNVSISGLPGGQTYAYELWCRLGRFQAGFPAEQLWAWYF